MAAGECRLSVKKVDSERVPLKPECRVSVRNQRICGVFASAHYAIMGPLMAGFGTWRWNFPFRKFGEIRKPRGGCAPESRFSLSSGIQFSGLIRHFSYLLRVKDHKKNDFNYLLKGKDHKKNDFDNLFKSKDYKKNHFNYLLKSKDYKKNDFDYLLKS
ncbi:MAG: hypothetical protein ABIT37_23750 [Luteolibacter sp.]